MLPCVRLTLPIIRSAKNTLKTIAALLFSVSLHAYAQNTAPDFSQDALHQMMNANPAPSSSVLQARQQAQKAAAFQQMSPDILKDVLDQLRRHMAVRAAFVQQRRNPALTQPQNSSGQLLFVAGHGMMWQVQQPYAQTLAFTSSKALNIDANGRMQSVRNERGISLISQMLQSMLAGQIDPVTHQFDVSASGTTGNWVLRLTPKQARVAQVLHGIELDGGTFLQDIHIDMKDGTQTDIHMTDTCDAGSFTALEKQALDLP